MKTFNEVIFEHTRPVLTVNCVIFGFDGKELNILLIRRDTHDHKEKWALPGALASMSETLEETARRSIREEANIDNVFLKQINSDDYNIHIYCYLNVTDFDQFCIEKGKLNYEIMNIIKQNDIKLALETMEIKNT